MHAREQVTAAVTGVARELPRQACVNPGRGDPGVDYVAHVPREGSCLSVPPSPLLCSRSITRRIELEDLRDKELPCFEPSIRRRNMPRPCQSSPIGVDHLVSGCSGGGEGGDAVKKGLPGPSPSILDRVMDVSGRIQRLELIEFQAEPKGSSVGKCWWINGLVSAVASIWRYPG